MGDSHQPCFKQDHYSKTVNFDPTVPSLRSACFFQAEMIDRCSQPHKWKTSLQALAVETQNTMTKTLKRYLKIQCFHFVCSAKVAHTDKESFSLTHTHSHTQKRKEDLK